MRIQEKKTTTTELYVVPKLIDLKLFFYSLKEFFCAFIIILVFVVCEKKENLKILSATTQ